MSAAEQCRATTVAGHRCRSMTRVVDGYCFQHRPATREAFRRSLSEDRTDRDAVALAACRRYLPAVEAGAAALMEKAEALDCRFEPTGAAQARQAAREVRALYDHIDGGGREA